MLEAIRVSIIKTDCDPRKICGRAGIERQCFYPLHLDYRQRVRPGKVWKIAIKAEAEVLMSVKAGITLPPPEIAIRAIEIDMPIATISLSSGRWGIAARLICRRS
jgi:hypothetical protein